MTIILVDDDDFVVVDEDDDLVIRMMIIILFMIMTMVMNDEEYDDEDEDETPVRVLSSCHLLSASVLTIRFIYLSIYDSIVLSVVVIECYSSSKIVTC